MRLTKEVDLGLLQKQMTAAGVSYRVLMLVPTGTPGEVDLLDLGEDGQPRELPNGAASVVDAHVAPLDPVKYVERIEVNAVLRTTDATERDVFVLPAEPKSLYRARLQMVAIDAGNGAVKSIEGILVWKRLLAANVVVPPSNITILSTIQDVAASTWIVNGQPQNGAFRIFVKGAAGRSIDWSLTGYIERFSPDGTGIEPPAPPPSTPPPVYVPPDSQIMGLLSTAVDSVPSAATRTSEYDDGVLKVFSFESTEPVVPHDPTQDPEYDGRALKLQAAMARLAEAAETEMQAEPPALSDEERHQREIAAQIAIERDEALSLLTTVRRAAMLNGVSDASLAAAMVMLGGEIERGTVETVPDGFQRTPAGLLAPLRGTRDAPDGASRPETPDGG